MKYFGVNDDKQQNGTTCVCCILTLDVCYKFPNRKIYDVVHKTKEKSLGKLDTTHIRFSNQLFDGMTFHKDCTYTINLKSGMRIE